MDKQLIERIALEVVDEIYHGENQSWRKDGIIAVFADRFLARIDAERGKEAVAWFLNSSPAGTAPFYEQVAKQYEGDTDTFPLFRSPTIPEGMALVPPSLPKSAEQYLQDRLHSTRCQASSVWTTLLSMLAAAQGECNAE